MTYRLGVDVGGTFTDLVLYDLGTDRLEFAKTPSRPGDEATGVAEGIRDLVERLGIPPGEIEFFIHGSTIATNALLQRKGARTALVVTSGFRDILQIGRQDRPHLYDWRLRRPEPLVPRHLRFEVRERILHTGEVLVPLDQGDLEALVDQVREADVEAVAVCLLHAYANASNERAIGQALRDALPHLIVALSHDILPEFKEYERMSTTTINAYVAAAMGRYLRSLQSSIAEVGVHSEVYIMQSNGGTMATGTAIEKPVHTILSGPAAGVIGSVALAKQAGESNVISVDMGGTSFDVCLTYEGEIRRTQETELDRLPIKVPMVDIHTLGAGGGSIAWLDPGGALRVGPHSAGANPGPSSYGLGGSEATVTDANLVLGRLNPERLLGGKVRLDTHKARQAVQDCIARPLGLTLEEAAEGIIRVVNAGMIKGIRVVSVAKGFDPREFCLVAFGGAGPLHASELAAELAIPRVLVPIAPGVTSALGLLMADLRYEFVRTVLSRGDQVIASQLGALYGEMEAEAVAQIRDQGLVRDGVSLVRLADIRYQGQGYELGVPVAGGDLADAQLGEVFQRFHQAHRQRYGYDSPDSPLEVVNLRVTALAKLPRPRLEASKLNGTTNPSGAFQGQRHVYFGGQSVSTSIYDRSILRPGDAVTGPAIMEQLDSTTVVWPNQTAHVDAYRNLVLERVRP
jgi:N-methylhydantoinase A